MTDKEIESFRYYTDALRNARTGYWSALLTINGILVAVFSYAILQSVANLWLSLIVIASSFACSVCLIRNFQAYIDLYEFLGNDPLVNSLSDQERKVQRTAAQNRYAAIVNRERIVTSLLYMQAVAIVLTIVSQVQK